MPDITDMRQTAPWPRDKDAPVPNMHHGNQYVKKIYYNIVIYKKMFDQHFVISRS